MDLNILGILLAVVSLVVTVVLAGPDNRRLAVEFLLRNKRSPDVVVAVVRKGDQVAVVHRKPTKDTKLFWQFPSGTVAEGGDLVKAAIDEVKDETGIIIRHLVDLGRRTHPSTGKLCVYLGCEWVSGSIVNADPDENIDARWIGTSELPFYMPKGVFKPALKFLSIA